MDFGTVIAGFLFSGVGFVAWRYGRRRDSPRHMLLGAALMAYTFVVPDTAAWTWGTGAALSLACLLP